MARSVRNQGTGWAGDRTAEKGSNHIPQTVIAGDTMLSSLQLDLCFASWQSFKGGAGRSQGSQPIQVAIGHENRDITPRMTVTMDKRRIFAIAVLIEHVFDTGSSTSRSPVPRRRTRRSSVAMIPSCSSRAVHPPNPKHVAQEVLSLV